MEIILPQAWGEATSGDAVSLLGQACTVLVLVATHPAAILPPALGQIGRAHV